MKNKIDKFFLIFIVIAVGASMYFTYNSNFKKQQLTSKNINFVCIITDEGNPICSFLFVYNFKQKFLNIITFNKNIKYNNKNILEYNEDDKLLSKNIISNLENIFNNKIKISYYVIFDYSVLDKLVDKMIFLNKENKSILKDLIKDYYISITKKRIDIIEQDKNCILEQKFINRFYKLFFCFYDIEKIKYIIKNYFYYKNDKCNFSFLDLFFIFLDLGKINTEDIFISKIPSVYNKKNYNIDIDAMGEFINIVLNNPNSSSVSNTITMDIFNGSGKNKLGETVAWQLRSNGYDVIDINTFDVVEDKTLIYDFSCNIRESQKIRNILSCGEIYYNYFYKNKRYRDINIILGKDAIVQ